MTKIAIVTDSTTYLPENIVEKLDIHVVPITVVWGAETYYDGIEITPDEFYTRLSSSKELPTTSQPSPADFEEFYTRLLDQGFEILSIHISQKLSGTIDSAQQAKAKLHGKTIEIVDALSASMGTGWAVIKAAQAAQNGTSLQECKQIAESCIRKTTTMFMVETLEFLHKGGRIGGASRFIGTALNFKPILKVEDGAIDAIERVRTTQKARKRMLEIAAEQINGNGNTQFSIIHANAPLAAEELRQMVEEQFGLEEVVVTMVSPGVGVHLGPGTLGISYMLSE